MNERNSSADPSLCGASAPWIAPQRHIAVICLASIAWAFSFGLGAPLASLWLHDQGYSDTLVGLNTAVYYLGIAITAAAVPGLMRRWGGGCVVAGMVASGITVAVLPWCGEPILFFTLRLVNGVAGAMSLIPVETIVNRHSDAEHRARHFGFYAFSIAFGWAAGNLIGLQMYPDAARLAFALGGSAGVVAALVVRSIAWPAEPVDAVGDKGSLELGRNFLSYGSAWSQGFLEGGMIGFLALYLLFLGLPETRVSWLTSGIMIGVIVFQVPVAWLADWLGRMPVIVGCYIATGFALVCLPFCDDSIWLPVGLLIAGACSGAFYPLGLALLGDRLPASRLARASAWYLSINCCGSLVGPVITGALMDQFGKRAMFAGGLAAVAGVLVFWLVGTAVARRVRRSGAGTTVVERQRAA
jgi:MFS family permease